MRLRFAWPHSARPAIERRLLDAFYACKCSYYVLISHDQYIVCRCRHASRSHHLPTRRGALECDAQGLRVAGVALLAKTRFGRWVTRPQTRSGPRSRISDGVGIDADAKMGGLNVVAEALNRGEIARAQIAALLLKLPDPGRVDPRSAAGLSKLAVLYHAGWMAKDWDASKHPRVARRPIPAGSRRPAAGARRRASQGSPNPPPAPKPGISEPDPATPADRRTAPETTRASFLWRKQKTTSDFPGRIETTKGNVFQSRHRRDRGQCERDRGSCFASPGLAWKTFRRKLICGRRRARPGSIGSLWKDHYIEHADEFGANSMEDYAEQANEFYTEARVERATGSRPAPMAWLRSIYDPKTNTFGSCTADGRTITFFKPDSRTYFDRQPGVLKKRGENAAARAAATEGKPMNAKAKFQCPICGCHELEIAAALAYEGRFL